MKKRKPRRKIPLSDREARCWRCHKKLTPENGYLEVYKGNTRFKSICRKCNSIDVWERSWRRKTHEEIKERADYLQRQLEFLRSLEKGTSVTIICSYHYDSSQEL